MRLIVISLIVLSLAGFTAYAQQTPSVPAEAPVSNDLKQAVELEALKKQVATLQQKLAAQTPAQIEENRVKAIQGLNAAVKKQYAACSLDGSKWIWMQASVGGQQVVFVGCTQR